MKKFLYSFILIFGSSATAFADFDFDSGMWPPFLISEKAERLKDLGLELDPKDLQDPTAFPLNAIIKLGNPRHLCSASFVSSEGLVATNHHCVEGFLSGNSKPGEDLVESGFLALKKEDEIRASETARLFITTQFRDVSAKILDSVEDGATASERYAAVQSQVKEAQEDCNAELDDGYICEVVSFFEGAQFFEIIQLEIRDVRLVYAPEKQIGFYGGFDDNWRWPRHTGDFSFLRAYVGEDGNPADYSPDNVPYQPASYLEVAQRGVSESDFVMVTGYPGGTSSLKTAAEAREAAEWAYPWRQEHYFGLVDVLAEATEGRQEARFKVQNLMFGLTNAAQLYEGSSKNMINFRLLADKIQLEVEMNRWLHDSEERLSRYQNVLEEMELLFARRRLTRNRDTAFNELTRATFSTSLLGAAESILKYAEAAAEARREGEIVITPIQTELITSLTDLYDQLDMKVDRAKFAFQLDRMAALSTRDQPNSYRRVARIAKASGHSVIEYLYDASWVTDPELALFMAQNASMDQIMADPMMKFAKLVQKERKQVQDRAAEFSGSMQVLRPLYVAALREYTGEVLFPDANSTLRVSYGQVMGYSVPEEGLSYTPFTTASQMLNRHQEEGVFYIPEDVRKAASQRNFGPYTMQNGELPVDYLTDLHITGGNSGSATLNARGEFVGLAFDSNYEGLGGDWRFIPELTRSIHVDSRYMLWVMDAVDCADHLIIEMGLTPQIENKNCVEVVGGGDIIDTWTASNGN